ncbi:MAG: N-acetyl-gamma-glutamyl-phosphate reductase [Anaerohalosphaeraceae bacterium]|nr:N-acetyl-gamma-glutamyl-phosphate reductase [Anaerohalosphaeraceae bacterium]
MIRVAIIGASGYTGVDAIEIFLRHKKAKLTYLTALAEECGKADEVFSQLKGRCPLDIEPLDMDKLTSLADVVFCCLPHKVSMGFVPKLLDAGLKVIDFSADYRIKDLGVYEKFYQPHTDAENLAHAVYGLCELNRENIKDAKLIANPGCFPTSVLLGTAPLLKNGLIENSFIVNSVTGASGAGKNPSKNFHFPNMNENFFAYGIGSHRHMPEMEQIAGELADDNVEILFQPHVGAFDRGILSSIYCQGKTDISDKQLVELFNEFYKDEQFVQILETAPMLKDVAGSNYCHIFPAVAKGKIVVFSAIDNLVKGASGQAVQNMNIMFGIDETEGLL